LFYSITFINRAFGEKDRLSADCPDDLQGKAEGGLVGSFKDAIEGILQLFIGE